MDNKQLKAIVTEHFTEYHDKPEQKHLHHEARTAIAVIMVGFATIGLMVVLAYLVGWI